MLNFYEKSLLTAIVFASVIFISACVAEDSITTNTIRTISDASRDADLNSLEIDGLTSSNEITKKRIEPNFNSNIMQYTVDLPGSTETITVLAETSSNRASIEFMERIETLQDAETGIPGFQISAPDEGGMVEIEVVVTAADRRTQKTYTLDITRHNGSSTEHRSSLPKATILTQEVQDELVAITSRDDVSAALISFGVINPDTIEVLQMGGDETEDLILSLRETQLDSVFSFLSDGNLPGVDQEIIDTAARALEELNDSLNNLFVFTNDADRIFFGTDDDGDSADTTIISALYAGAMKDSNNGNFSFTALCEARMIEIPEDADALQPANPGASLQVTIPDGDGDGNPDLITATNGEYTFPLADAGSPLEITITITAEDDSAMSSRVLTVTTPTQEVCDAQTPFLFAPTTPSPDEINLPEIDTFPDE